MNKAQPFQAAQQIGYLHRPPLEAITTFPKVDAYI
jgi:hypothetical protein